MYRTLYTCSTCGSEEVFCDAWASLNEEERVIRFDALHCENCEGECSVNEQEVECDGSGEVKRPIRARVRGRFQPQPQERCRIGIKAKFIPGEPARKAA